MKEKISLTIHAEFDAGTDILDACKQAVFLATRLEIWVRFHFNGVEVNAGPWDDPRDLAGAWKIQNCSKYKTKIAYASQVKNQ